MYIINTNVLEILEQSTLDKDIHTIHTSEGDFSAQVKMTTQGSLYASNAVMLEAEIRGDHRDLKRKEITYTREVASKDVNGGTSETIDYGTFIVLEVDYDISSEKTTLVCYDLMVKTQQEYDSELFTYPTTVHNLLLSLASACDLELDTNTYKGSNLPITSNVWVNVNYTYRDILNHIAQLTTNTIKMKSDKLHLFDYEDTGVQLNRFANLKIGEDYGPTNILNISYEPQRDNVFSPANANDIPKDQRKELAFVNNPIFMGNEQSYADTLLPQLTNMTYATSEFRLYHGGIFQVGDMVEVFNGTEYVRTLITQQVLDSSNVQSEYVSSVPFTFKSEYVVETDEKRQGQTTYFIVDKQNGMIQGLVEKTEELDDGLVETQSSLTLLDSKINLEVSELRTELENIELTPGPQGPQGIPGQDGSSLYTWIKYADTPTSGMSDLPAGKKYMGIAVNQTTKTESTNYADYTWSKVEGDQGIPGTPGADGKPTYTWVKYADTPTTGMDDDPTDKKYIGLAFNKPTSTMSTDYSEYQWSLMPQNIEIGGRNLLKDSGEEVSNGNYNIARYNLTDDIKENEEVTLTIWGELASTKSNFGAYNSGGSVSVATLTNNGDGTYSSTFKWKIGSSTNTYLSVYAFTNTQTGTSTINKIKLERGNVATDWTPAPEDVEAEIKRVEVETNGRIDVTNTAVTTEVSERKTADGEILSETRSAIAVLTDNINLKVDKNGVISAINVSPELIKILSKNIALEGYTSINDHFKVLPNGDVQMVNADVSGKITAKTGQIGNFILDNGVQDYLTDVSNRDYTYSDMVIMKQILENQLTPNAYQKFTYDIDGNGVIDVVDMAMLEAHLRGTYQIEKPIKSRVRLGTADGRVETTVMYGTSFNQKGPSFIMQGERLRGTLIDTDALSIDNHPVWHSGNRPIKYQHNVTVTNSTGEILMFSFINWSDTKYTSMSLIASSLYGTAHVNKENALTATGVIVRSGANRFISGVFAPNGSRLDYVYAESTGAISVSNTAGWKSAVIKDYVQSI